MHGTIDSLRPTPERAKNHDFLTPLFFSLIGIAISLLAIAFQAFTIDGFDPMVIALLGP